MKGKRRPTQDTTCASDLKSNQTRRNTRLEDSRDMIRKKKEREREVAEYGDNLMFGHINKSFINFTSPKLIQFFEKTRKVI